MLMMHVVVTQFSLFSLIFVACFFQKILQKTIIIMDTGKELFECRNSSQMCEQSVAYHTEANTQQYWFWQYIGLFIL